MGKDPLKGNLTTKRWNTAGSRQGEGKSVMKKEAHKSSGLSSFQGIWDSWGKQFKYFLILNIWVGRMPHTAQRDPETLGEKMANK